MALVSESDLRRLRTAFRRADPVSRVVALAQRFLTEDDQISVIAHVRLGEALFFLMAAGRGRLCDIEISWSPVLRCTVPQSLCRLS